ncbi:VOC family protein [Pseudonocardia ailaonensis]|uniref:VOC family protein n=1 Tax=Pseudonocardia ailaonensis TaxID=367279 RepID=UPI003CD094D6
MFQPVPKPKAGKNRLHLDLAPATGTQRAEIDRLVALGATPTAPRCGSSSSTPARTWRSPAAPVVPWPASCRSPRPHGR